jgi:predicted nucleic acid-binding protein
MRVVDTSAWIEWLIGSPTGRKVEPLLPETGAWLVPTIVQLELSKWLRREVAEDKADQVMAFLETCVIAALDSAMALAAAERCVSLRLATADAIVYATAQEHGAELLTCDAHFETLPGVRLVAKQSR